MVETSSTSCSVSLTLHFFVTDFVSMCAPLCLQESFRFFSCTAVVSCAPSLKLFAWCVLLAVSSVLMLHAATAPERPGDGLAPPELRRGASGSCRRGVELCNATALCLPLSLLLPRESFTSPTSGEAASAARTASAASRGKVQPPRGLSHQEPPIVPRQHDLAHPARRLG